MSDKCDVCKRSEEGDGGCAFPCNLCCENDTIQALKKFRNNIGIVIILCQSLNITTYQLDHDVKDYFEVEEERTAHE